LLEIRQESPLSRLFMVNTKKAHRQNKSVGPWI